jgi:hypothetical protein
MELPLYLEMETVFNCVLSGTVEMCSHLLSVQILYNGSFSFICNYPRRHATAVNPSSIIVRILGPELQYPVN